MCFLRAPKGAGCKTCLESRIFFQPRFVYDWGLKKKKILGFFTGADKPAGECILYPNGEVDPWHALSVLTSPSPGVGVLMVSVHLHVQARREPGHAALHAIDTVRQTCCHVSCSVGVGVGVGVFAGPGCESPCMDTPNSGIGPSQCEPGTPNHQRYRRQVPLADVRAGHQININTTVI